MREQLDSLSLLSFLDSFSEPAFILCSSSSPHDSVSFIYGNPALHQLVLGEDETAVLDDSTFFNILSDNRDLRWLSNPGHSGSLDQTGVGRTILIRPAWLPRDHVPLQLELIATHIILPLTIPAVNSHAHSFVFIAAPRNVSTQLLRTDPIQGVVEKQQSVISQGPLKSDGSMIVWQRETNRTSLSSASRRSPTELDSEKLPSRLLHTFPWEETPLGPRAGWPRSLETMVRYIMTKPVPTTIYWGWPELIMIYNDAYAKLAGTKHPSIYGQRASIAWDGLWDTLSPVAELCKKGQATSKADDPMFYTSLTEYGLPQEVYHTWHWTPIWDDNEKVGGALNSSFETTGKVTAERRLACVADLISEISESMTRAALLDAVIRVLSNYAIDLPFLALYTCSTTNPTAPSENAQNSKHGLFASLLKVRLHRHATVGIPEGHRAAPEMIEYLLDSHTLFVYRAALSSPRIQSGSPRSSPSDPLELPAAPLELPSAPLESPLTSINTPSAEPYPGEPTPTASGTKLATSVDQSNLWPIQDVFASGAIEIVAPLPDELGKGLDTRAFKDQPRRAALIPIPQAGSSSSKPSVPFAVLIAGLNTRQSYDADYARWLTSIASAFATRLAVVLKIELDAEIMCEQTRLDKAKTMFFMTVSHELRTPLTLIQAPLEQMAETTTLQPSEKSKIAMAMRNVKRLRKLVDSVLDMSKLEAGQLIGQFRPVQLDQLTADMASLFQSMADKKGVKLQLEVEAKRDLAPFTYVDIQLWEKIFCNLLSNAFKYTKRGKITVSVTYDFTFSYLRVCDTGIGIPKDKQEQIFEQFQRVHDLPVEGSGIGLSLAKELVNLHGGKLVVSSRAEGEYVDDTGSVFTVIIPLGSKHLPQEMVTDQSNVDVLALVNKSNQDIEYWLELEASSPPRSSDSGDEKPLSSTLFFEQTDVVLVVDDNADMRGFIRSIFAPYLHVLEAMNGFDALEIARTQHVDLILSDVAMHKMDGIELLGKLREKKETALIPMMFVTAVADDVGLFSGEANGIVDCVSKPFRVRDLLARAHLQLQIGKRRIKLENEFAERSRELSTLVDLCPVGIFRADGNGTLSYTNAIWNDLAGSRNEEDKEDWLDRVHPNSRAEALRVWRACFLDHQPQKTRVQWTAGHWTQFNVAPLLGPNDVLFGAFGTVTDITDLYRLEESRVSLAEERERNAAIRAEDAESQRLIEVERRRAQGWAAVLEYPHKAYPRDGPELLIDVTSHELRQPVSAILQNAEVVRENMKTLRDRLVKARTDRAAFTPMEISIKELEEDLQAMDSITQCGLSQARIANDILSLSKIQLGALSILPTTFELKNEVKTILRIFKNELTSKNIGLGVTYDRSLEDLGISTVKADRSRLTQIITNLMSNAIRFTEMSSEKREIQVTLSVAPEPPADDTCAPPPMSQYLRAPYVSSVVYVYMSIKDSGPGLQQEDLALLFQRFQQGSNAHHVFGGSGLGLFVCRQLCGLMGGRIEVQNANDIGAVFRFFIQAEVPATHSRPLTPQARPRSPPIRTRRSSEHHTPSTQSLHVLVTEDNEINQRIFRRQLKRAGFSVELASNGALAIDAVKSIQSTKGHEDAAHRHFDVILMDLQMPVMDGFTAVREIRSLEQSGMLPRRNFILAVTGNARSEQVQAAWDSGVDGVVIKPYVLDELLKTMLAGANKDPSQ